MTSERPKRTRKPRPRRPRVRGALIRAVYSADLGRAICTRLAAGEAWADMAARGPMPSFTQLWAWRNRHPAFAEALAQAREIAAERSGALPTNLDRLEEDLMTDEDDGPAIVRRTKGPRNKTPRKDGTVAHVRYSRAAAQRICHRLAEGAAWKHIANTDDLPAYSTLYDWSRKHPEFGEAVRAARAFAAECGAEARFETAFDLAMQTTAETVNADKVKIALLMQQAERLDPERYGPPGRRGEGARDDGRIHTIVVRRFERATGPDGVSYVRAIDSVQEVGE